MCFQLDDHKLYLEIDYDLISMTICIDRHLCHETVSRLFDVMTPSSLYGYVPRTFMTMNLVGVNITLPSDTNAEIYLRIYKMITKEMRQYIKKTC